MRRRQRYRKGRGYSAMSRFASHGSLNKLCPVRECGAPPPKNLHKTQYKISLLENMWRNLISPSALYRVSYQLRSSYGCTTMGLIFWCVFRIQHSKMLGSQNGLHTESLCIYTSEETKGGIKESTYTLFHKITKYCMSICILDAERENFNFSTFLFSLLVHSYCFGMYMRILFHVGFTPSIGQLNIILFNF